MTLPPPQRRSLLAALGEEAGVGDRFLADDLPAVVLGGLAGDAAEALLAARAGGAVDQQVRDQLIAATDGNPLALGGIG
ncbi:hypothetical protein [Nakamurella sp.]|uniref:hypothetical protein n=1 Tax=Nakamurella sp. TaxID=1869182 RepID=UPI003783DD72